MKTSSLISIVFVAALAVLLGEHSLQARSFGVSSSSAGRGTMYTSSRGGQAYVGPHGAVGESAGGRYGAATERGAAVAGPNGAAARGRYGEAYSGRYGEAYSGRYGAAYSGQYGTAVAGRYGSAAASYLRSIPAGAAMVSYGGYNCYSVGGVYYRPIIYGGETVYVVVQ